VLLCAAARLPQVGHLEVLQLIAEHSGDLDASDKRGRLRVFVCFVCFALVCRVVLCLLCFALLVLLVCVFVLLTCRLDRLFVCLRTIIGLLARGFVCGCVCSVPLSPWCYLCPFVFRIAPLARWFCLLRSPLACLFVCSPACCFVCSVVRLVRLRTAPQYGGTAVRRQRCTAALRPDEGGSGGHRVAVGPRRTALMCAAQGGHVELLRFLASCRVDLNLQTEKTTERGTEKATGTPT
jgi:hypothetical protein